MRRWMAAPLVFALVIGLLSQETPRAAAQPKNGAALEPFSTADGVELQGIFHPAKAEKTSEAPVVVFLYPPGVDHDMTKGDWASLTKRLNAEGYHVFQFDWRGHGKSTDIKDKEKFWNNGYLNRPGASFNAYIRGGPPKMPLKSDISVKDIANNMRYMPAYLNDLAAVRVFLDSKNDKGELNSSTIYIVGVGDTAALGFAWLTAEWNRPRVAPNVNELRDQFDRPVARYEFVPQPLKGGIPNAAGTDFGGAVWLTPTRPPSFPGATMQKWISSPAPTGAPKLRENNPMLFLYAESDTKGKMESDFYYNQVLVAEPRKGSSLAKLKQTFMQDVKGAEKLQGLKLLGPKTEETIVKYFSAIQKERLTIASKARDYKDQYYFIDVNIFGLRR